MVRYFHWPECGSLFFILTLEIRWDIVVRPVLLWQLSEYVSALAAASGIPIII